MQSGIESLFDRLDEIRRSSEAEQKDGLTLIEGGLIGASTQIIRREDGSVSPMNSVVLPDSRPVRMGNDEVVNMPSALIVKLAGEGTRAKVDLNNLVRN